MKSKGAYCEFGWKPWSVPYYSQVGVVGPQEFASQKLLGGGNQIHLLVPDDPGVKSQIFEVVGFKDIRGIKP